jgi:hypothetical protein
MRAVAGIALALTLAATATAEAAGSCGWYAIVSCTEDEQAARDFGSDTGWGMVINTDDYEGLSPGLFCVVSGPQSRASALRDVRAAKRQRIAADAYAKRACTDVVLGE